MADSILRLRVSSEEYDNKLKQATNGLTRYVDECRKVGGTLEVVEKETLDYVRALGQMDTTTRTATGKLAEMKKTFTELSAQYKQMTDAEKQSPFGKALAASLDQLKTRIQEGKSQLDDINKSINGGGGLTGALDSVAGKFGLNIGQLTKFGGALALAKGALETVKGAIESTEAGHDQLARAIAVTDNITNQFLRSLATADFSNFINGLQGIIDKTIDAYNAMDEFESYAARFQPWQQAKEGEIQTKIMQARAAKAKGENDRAEKLNKEAKDLIKQLAESTQAYGEKQTKGGFSTIRSLMGSVDISDQQIAWYADPRNWEQAKQKAQQFANTQERIKQLEKDIHGYRRSGETEMGYAMRVGAAQMEKNRLEEMLRRDQSLKRAYTMQNLRDSGDSEQAQALKQAFSNIYGNKMAKNRVESLMARADRMEGVLSRSALGSGGGGGKVGGTTKAEVQAVSGSIDEQTKKVQELQKAWRAAANDDSRQKIKKELGEAEAILDRMTGKETFDPSKMRQIQGTAITPSMKIKNPFEGIQNLKAEVELELKEEQIKIDKNTLHTFLSETIQRGIDDLDPQMSILSEKIGKGINVPDEAWQNLQDQLNEKLAEMGLNPIDINLSTGNKGNGKKNPYLHEEDGKNTVKLNEVLGGLAGGMSQMVKGMESLGIELPEGINKAIGAIDGIASILTAIQAIITAIEAISAADALIPFARGGIVRAAGGYVVPGTRYSGDLVPAALSSGELVLNQAQQGNLASQLQGAGLSGMQLSAVISGEQIKMVLNNNSRRTGRGEYVTTKFN